MSKILKSHLTRTSNINGIFSRSDKSDFFVQLLPIAEKREEEKNTYIGQQIGIKSHLSHLEGRLFSYYNMLISVTTNIKKSLGLSLARGKK